MNTIVRHTWIPAEVVRPLPRPLPGRVAAPLIGLICAALWLGIFAIWRAVG